MKIAVSFSGGKDSQVCLIWAVEKYGKDKVEAVELAIYEDGFIPMFKLTEKGRYAIITNANSLTFDWREGKIKVK